MVRWNKSPFMKEWMAQADSPKEAIMFERMTHYFIE